MVSITYVCMYMCIYIYMRVFIVSFIYLSIYVRIYILPHQSLPRETMISNHHESLGREIPGIQGPEPDQSRDTMFNG